MSIVSVTIKVITINVTVANTCTEKKRETVTFSRSVKATAILIHLFIHSVSHAKSVSHTQVCIQAQSVEVTVTQVNKVTSMYCLTQVL